MCTSTQLLSSPKWFAAYTAPRHEKKVNARLNGCNVETFLPLYRTVRLWSNRTRVTLELPLFPCYVFVRITPQDQGMLLSTPGVFSLVGSKREPWPLSDFEMETLRSGLHRTRPEPHEYLIAGERLRIQSGPLAGMQGVLVRKKNSLRIVLTLHGIRQSFSVEVSANDVEPVSAVHPA